MTPTQTLERLEALLEKVTPGEYVADVAPTPYDDEDERAQVMVRDKHGRLFLIAIIENGAFGDTIDTERCNAEAFAALKNAAPLLLALARDGIKAEKYREALVQARGALTLDHMVDSDGKPFGTTTVALEAIDDALGGETK